MNGSEDWVLRYIRTCLFYVAFFPVWVQPQQLIMCLKGFGHGGIWLWRVLSIRDNVTAGFYIIWKRFDPCWGLSMWSCLDALIPGWVCPQVLCSWGGVFVGFYSWGILSTSNLLRREYIFSQFHSTVNASENQNSTQNTGRHNGASELCLYTCKQPRKQRILSGLVYCFPEIPTTMTYR